MINPNGASVANFNRLNEWPLQFLRTGNYYRSYGYPDGRTWNGNWWLFTAGSATDGHPCRQRKGPVEWGQDKCKSGLIT